MPRKEVERAVVGEVVLAGHIGEGTEEELRGKQLARRAKAQARVSVVVHEFLDVPIPANSPRVPHRRGNKLVAFLQPLAVLNLGGRLQLVHPLATQSATNHGGEL